MMKVSKSERVPSLGDVRQDANDKESLSRRLKRALTVGALAVGAFFAGAAIAHAEEPPAPETATIVTPVDQIEEAVNTINSTLADTQAAVNGTVEQVTQSVEITVQDATGHIEQSIAQAQKNIPKIEDATPEDPVAVGDVVVAIASPVFDSYFEHQYGTSTEQNPNDSKFDGSEPLAEQVADATELVVSGPVEPNHHSDVPDGEATTKQIIERTLADIDDTMPEDGRKTFEETETIYMPRFSPGYITISPEDFTVCATMPGNTSYCDGIIRTSDGLLNIRPDALEVEGYGTNLTDEEKSEAIDAVLTIHEYGHADDDRKMREATGTTLSDYVDKSVDLTFVAEQSGDRAAGEGLKRMLEARRLSPEQVRYGIEWIKYHSYEGEPTHGGPVERGGQLEGTAEPAPTPLEYAIAHSMGMSIK